MAHTADLYGNKQSPCQKKRVAALRLTSCRKIRNSGKTKPQFLHLALGAKRETEPEKILNYKSSMK